MRDDGGPVIASSWRRALTSVYALLVVVALLMLVAETVGRGLPIWVKVGTSFAIGWTWADARRRARRPRPAAGSVGGLRLVVLPPCEVCGFKAWPEGGMHAARSIHMRAHERRAAGEASHE